MTSIDDLEVGMLVISGVPNDPTWKPSPDFRLNFGAGSRGFRPCVLVQIIDIDKEDEVRPHVLAAMLWAA